MSRYANLSPQFVWGWRSQLLRSARFCSRRHNASGASRMTVLADELPTPKRESRLLEKRSSYLRMISVAKMRVRRREYMVFHCIPDYDGRWSL